MDIFEALPHKSLFSCVGFKKLSVDLTAQIKKQNVYSDKYWGIIKTEIKSTKLQPSYIL